MKYFVTGATGFVGGRVARMLRQAGHDVIAVVRTPEKAKDLAALGIDVRKGDVTDKDSMRAPMSGVDGVYHIAGWYKVGVRDKSEGARINIEGTRNVLELMQALNIRKGVYTSTLAINSDTRGIEVDETYRFTGKHISEYDRTKAEAHKVAAAFIAQGLPLVIVQPGLIYGPGDTSAVRGALRQALTRKLPMMPQKTAYSWAHIDDIAHGHLAAMERGRIGESYNICGPSHTFIEGLRMVEAVSGVKAPSLTGTPGLLKAMSAMMGVIEKVVPVPDNYSSEFLRVSAGVTYIGTNAKARRELGFNPRALADGWPDTIRHEMKDLGITRQ
jgi:nucleoside-diphosphate-sugar epimerase